MVLTLMVAPAILANASSLMAMSTSNRLARAVDRARELAREMREQASEELRASFERTEQRAHMLLKALKFFYAALGSFAAAALLSVAGAILASSAYRPAANTISILAVLVGTAAVACLAAGCVVLVRETSLAVASMSRDFRRAVDQSSGKIREFHHG